jgi:cytochrome P450
VAARDGDDRLSEEELVAFGVTLLVAGHETTVDMLANAVYTLFERPDLFQRLRDDPDLLPATIEELVRHVPPASVVAMPRIATEDVELGGVTVRAGDAVLVDMTAANRNPSIFEHGDELDPHREANPHLAFGFGVHHCLGASPARTQVPAVGASRADRGDRVQARAARPRPAPVAHRW